MSSEDYTRSEDKADEPAGEVVAHELSECVHRVGSVAVEEWHRAGGPPFGSCSVCFSGVSCAVVLPCGHIACRAHVEGTIQPCRWAPACAERSFPNKFGERPSPASATLVQSLLDRGVSAASPKEGRPPAASGGTGAEWAAAVAGARSPLEAIEALTFAADVAEGAQNELRAAAARTRAKQLWDQFAIPAPVMATRMDRLRHGARWCTPNEVVGLYGECPLEQRIKAKAALDLAAKHPSEFREVAQALPGPAPPGAHEIAVPEGARGSLETLLDCAVCYTPLYEPVTVACGHCFCRRCLARQLDFERGCPLCREKLSGFVDRYPVTVGLGEAIEALVPGSASQGKIAVQKENDDLRDWLPVFVCTLAFPTRECPLHVFEPRYRLMMRRAISSGIRRFGMCVPVQRQLENPDMVTSKGYSSVGTVLYIREIRMLPDGRSLIDCIGEKRFKVLECSERDGYNVARVEDIEESDEFPEDVVSDCRKRSRDLIEEYKPFFRGAKLPSPEEDPDGFFWRTLEELPMSDGIKFHGLITVGRAERFMILQDLLEKIRLRLIEMFQARGGVGGAGGEEGEEDMEVEGGLEGGEEEEHEGDEEEDSADEEAEEVEVD